MLYRDGYYNLGRTFKGPACASYRAFMSGLLILINKRSVVHPVVVEETWWPLFANCVLRVTGSEYTNVFQYYHLCDILKAVID